MFGSSLLDVAIGMVFIYLLLSLICSAANEIIERWLKNRATDLERGIRELLEPNSSVSTTGIVSQLYDHPLINGLFKGTYREYAIYKTSGRFERFKSYLGRLFTLFLGKQPSELPSYIPARNFALALMDTILPANKTPALASPPASPPANPPANTPSGAAFATSTPPTDPNAPNPLAPLREAIGQFPEEQTRKALLALVDAAGNDVNKARENIEAWFNSTMDRVSGWYKRRAHLIIFILGFVVAVAMNADSIILVNSLSRDKAMRDSLVAAAEAYAKANPTPTPAPGQSSGGEKKQEEKKPSQQSECDKDPNSQECKIEKIRQQIDKLGLPMGWKGEDAARTWPGRSLSGWWDQLERHLLGWLITALAISLGAPFWFDLLNKFIVVRSTVKPHEKSPEEPSKR